MDSIKIGTMDAKGRSRLAWLLPFLVSGGMAFGTLLGMAWRSDAASQSGPAGDMAGAAEALVVVICLLTGGILSLLTVILAKVLHHRPPQRLLLRLGLSLAGGGLIGMLAPNSRGMTTVATWGLLTGVPILLSWSGRTAEHAQERQAGR